MSAATTLGHDVGKKPACEALGMPEEVARVKGSYTGRFLRFLRKILAL